MDIGIVESAKMIRVGALEKRKTYLTDDKDEAVFGFEYKNNQWLQLDDIKDYASQPEPILVISSRFKKGGIPGAEFYKDAFAKDFQFEVFIEDGTWTFLKTKR